jgi:glycine dehydrogenase subunit 2
MKREELIFEQSRPGRRASTHAPATLAAIDDLPAAVLRETPPPLPEVSELQVVRHFTRLSQLNFSIDTHFYPLGSCTMKYNPRVSNTLAMLPGFLARHPLEPDSHAQGVLESLYELQEMLKAATGMSGVSLTPMAGAQGEFAGIAMIRAWHLSRGDTERTQVIVPDAAHGTNPATATMCGCEAIEIPTGPDGDVDLDALRQVVGPKTAAIMLTNPSTLGVFERRIARLPKSSMRPADCSITTVQTSMRSWAGRCRRGWVLTSCTSICTRPSPRHTAAAARAPASWRSMRVWSPSCRYRSSANAKNGYMWLTEADRPQTIGRLSGFMGNTGILLRAYIYMRLLGAEGMRRVSGYATLNANYLCVRLAAAGFTIAYPRRRASHEFIISLKDIARDTGATAMDFAKALLDRGFHAPTTYFPLLVPECLLIEPTETEARQELDAFVQALSEIRDLAFRDVGELKRAPQTTPVRRLDDVRAARQLDLTWQGKPRTVN